MQTVHAISSQSNEAAVYAEVLEIIAAKRIETGNPDLGAAIEQAILQKYSPAALKRPSTKIV